jgi:hypothetical protein
MMLLLMLMLMLVNRVCRADDGRTKSMQSVDISVRSLECA